ncbi:riboflavin biosynthesis protein RibD [Reticulibacter mediterranei]|uniref:Riboflavin biosynthesis protein RibD n=1 Tax=Reticulibacter mediterranei TaxID=2778369 RepID=A0A8J3IK73_9CHLR|nr:bifunctional diaminohydroxyphosphoribosylaminopyrimidine deaminase/5-amino-6-(5-phosphoribosylamino)uracil reductase RibD [Reticulibacter mediterranei]GHO92802.1 riboflavin biosynthesis protein RibD [Reticulibacter mediterranei]
MDDREAMRLAIACAHSVEGRTSPRPSVGAVVVRNGRVIGKGATSPPYGPHAEVHALREAGEAARGADLYATLEPCCITIHTPPCTKAIIEAGVRRVVVGSVDPNPLVCEQGFAQLRAAGIEIVTGVEAEETDAILRPFATFITQGRPHITAKWAMTLDGKLASHTGDAYWISGSQARVWVHNLRDRVDAIMVGAGTAHADNPQLTVRLTPEQREYERAERSGPLRVILATNGQLAPALHLLQPELASGTCVIVGTTCPAEQIARLQTYGVEVVPVSIDTQGQIDLHAALQALAGKGIMHVLLEGGAHLFGSAFDRGLIDSVAVFIAPKLVGGAEAPAPLKGTGLASMQDAVRLHHRRTRIINEDVLVEGELQWNTEESSRGE